MSEETYHQTDETQARRAVVTALDLAVVLIKESHFDIERLYFYATQHGMLPEGWTQMHVRDALEALTDELTARRLRLEGMTEEQIEQVINL